MGKGLVLWVRAEEGDHSSRDKNKKQKEAKYGFPNKRLLLFIEVFEKFCDKISRV